MIRTFAIVWGSTMNKPAPEEEDLMVRRFPNGDIRDAWHITEVSGGPRYYRLTGKQIDHLHSLDPIDFEIAWEGDSL